MTRYALPRQLLALSALVAAVVGLSAPAERAAVGLRHPERWVHAAGADEATAQLAALAAWWLLAWLAIGVALVLLSRLPGVPAACLARAGSSALPAALRHALGVGIGVSVGLAVVAAPTWSATAAPPSSSRPVAGQFAVDVPVIAAAQPPVHELVTLSTSPALPSGSATQDPASTPKGYVVRPGDSLWSIAKRCGPGISDARAARLWPSWYAKNRDVIGADPARVSAGVVLQEPGTACAEHSR